MNDGGDNSAVDSRSEKKELESAPLADTSLEVRADESLVKHFTSAWLSILKTRGGVVILGFLVALAFAVMIATGLEWSEVTIAFARAQWLPWLPLAVSVYILGMLLRGLRLKLLVVDESELSVATASNIVAVGYVTNNILPLRLGEFARAGMLAERTGLPYLLALTITFLERLLDGLVIIFLFVAGSLLIPVSEEMRQYAGLAAILFAFAILVVGFITLSPQSAIGLTSNLTAWMGRKWHHKFLSIVTQINRGFACLRDAKSALLVLASSLLVWVFEALFFMLVLPCFGMPLGFVRSTVTMAVTNLGILIPNSPGYVGVYHYACQNALLAISSVPGITPGTMTPLSVDEATAFSYAVVVHFVFFATVTIWGIIAIVKYSLEVGVNQALTWEARPIETLSVKHHESASVIISVPDVESGITPKLSQFWAAICECFLPEDVVPLIKESERAEVLEEVGRFTFTQIACIPFRYRILFDIGLTGFKFYIFFLSGRFLCDLSLKKRRALVESWAFGKVALTRKFMKPIRSLAILAYYDNPVVQAGLARLAEEESEPESDASNIDDKKVNA